MRILHLFISAWFTIAFSISIHAQKVINVVFPADGTVRLSENITVPKIDAGYTLWKPSSGKTVGMIIFFHSRRDTINQDVLIQNALKNQLAVLYATTNNPLEFFFKESRMQEIANYISVVCNNFQIPSNNLLFCGLSLEGLRALKLTVFLKQNPTYNHIVPRAIAICDAPMDMFRFYQSALKNNVLINELLMPEDGNWISTYVKNNLEGPPDQSLARYIQHSPFAKSVRNGGNASYFKNIPLRVYTEPNLDWLLENSRMEYFHINSFDMIGFVDQLYLLGSESAEIIATKYKEELPEGERKSYDWSIIDEEALVAWFVNKIQF